MNIFEALNQGDASIRETHLTSILYYLFKETHRANPNNSLLSYFIKKYIPHFKVVNFALIDIETDIRIEEILIYNNLRRDTDITIYINQNSQLTIINIENKIYHQSFQEGQIDQQESLLKAIHPNCEVINILILPFQNNNHSYNHQCIFWHAESNSLISSINNFLSSILNKKLFNFQDEIFISNCIEFLNSFANTIEQDKLNSFRESRGPKNVLRKTMFEYLSEIACKWESIFLDNQERVTVQNLLDTFEKMVCYDISIDFPLESAEKIAKFKRGALEAQPKIATINERNRIHFGVTNNSEKQLFYYPDSPNGSLKDRWKNTRIKPITKMNENMNYTIFWKNLQNNNVEESIYANPN